MFPQPWRSRDPDSKVVSGDRWFGIAAEKSGQRCGRSAIAALREQLKQLESARGDRAETDERKLVTIVFADVSVQSRCLTYRAVAFRRLGDGVRCTTEATENARTRHETRDDRIYCDGKSKLGVDCLAAGGSPRGGSKALELWHGMDDPYGFDWMALCPLIAIALYWHNSGAVIGFAQGLLAENQHPLPEKLLNPTRKAGDEWQNGAQEIAIVDLAAAINVARELSYL